MKTEKTWLYCIIAMVFTLVGTSAWSAPPAKDTGVPSGFSILGETPTPPAGYTYTGYSIANDKWTRKADMPTLRWAFAVASVNNKIYVIGGYTRNDGWLRTNEEYDPATNTWTTKADMPTARGYFGVAVANNKIYAIGGYGSGYAGTWGPGWSYFTTNEEYNPVTNTWTAKADLPSARDGFGLAAVNNKIYAIGGRIITRWEWDEEGWWYPIEESVKTNEEYNPVTNTWTRKADGLFLTSISYYGVVAAAANNKIYAFQASSSGEYNPATDSWAAKGSPSQASWAVTVNNKIYANTGLYDPATDQWSIGGGGFTGGAAAINNKIYNIVDSWEHEWRSECWELDIKLFYIHRKN